MLPAEDVLREVGGSAFSGVVSPRPVSEHVGLASAPVALGFDSGVGVLREPPRAEYGTPDTFLGPESSPILGVPHVIQVEVVGVLTVF